MNNQSSSYRIYVLIVLMLINLLNAIDRLLPGILAERIKKDLHLADWQLGAMTGFAFAIFLSLLGLPIARLADRKHRPFIIACCLAIWSAFTTLCGVAGSFGALFFYRMGVGVGEAGCTPPAHSLIADSTPRDRRTSALAFHTLGIPLGIVIGFGLGGIIADAYGWRAAFFMAGGPGMAIALITHFTVKEPRTSAVVDVIGPKAPQPTFGEALRLLRTKPTFWLVAIAGSLTSFTAYAQSAFIASFFLRNHAAGLKVLGELLGLHAMGFLGVVIGVLAGGGGAIGIVAGGWITDRVIKLDFRNALTAPAVAAVLQAPFLIAALLCDNMVGAFLLLIPPYILNSVYYGPVYAIAQSVVPGYMRATTAGILIFVFAAIGLGLGPLTVGILSDAISSHFNLTAGAGLRAALLISTCVTVPGCICYYFARKTILDDFEG